jgi:hypothetical protein
VGMMTEIRFSNVDMKSPNTCISHIRLLRKYKINETALINHVRDFK